MKTLLLLLGMASLIVVCSVGCYMIDVSTVEQGWKGYFKWLLNSIKRLVMGEGNYSPPDIDEKELQQ